jgi:transposase
MTIRDQLIRARFAILAMAGELNNIAKACKIAGVSRSQFYGMKKAYELNGKEGLAPRTPRKPEMPNRTPAVLEEQILLQTRKNPLISYVRLAGEINSKGGGSVTPSMVRYVWQRHGLSTQSARRTWVKLMGDRSRLQATKDVSRGEALDRPRQGESSHDGASVVD